MQRAFRSGDPFIWVAGGALATSLLMIGGLLLLIATRGLGFFWPGDVALLELQDGKRALGQLRSGELPPASVDASPVQLQVGNRDVYGADFRWFKPAEITAVDHPVDAVVVERMEWGNLYGFVAAVHEGEKVVASDPAAAWKELSARLPRSRALADEARALEREEIASINREMEQVRLRNDASAEAERAILETKYQEAIARLELLLESGRRDAVVVRLVDGQEKTLPLTMVVRAYRPNGLGGFGKARVYAAKLWEFIAGDPRESNTEGGVFPAIFGTVMMVLTMTIAVVPFGVLTALYLREYAREGIVVRLVRIAINNLAGVPSIVFGVFGLGFFVYFLGGQIDALFYADRLPAPTFGTGGILWASLTLALLTVPVVVVATEEALAAVPRENREGSLALGATRFETIWRVVLPQALPGVFTGMILAMARGAGEVAPLMLTGVVKLAAEMPFDANFPFLHLDRKFMHLGFHIYDVGFQSPNVEAAKPMVYATALLLVMIIVALNLGAVMIRNRLRRRFTGSTF